jgi:hypothetical protein
MHYRRALRYEPLEDRRLLAAVAVNTLADTVDRNDGLTSLREAIFATNLIAGADTVRLDASIVNGGSATITLVHGELRITDSLTIDFPPDRLTIDASGSDPTLDENNGDGSRVFNIDDGDDATRIDVWLRGLTLGGGDALNSGGAILSRENVTLDGCEMIDNSASSNILSMLSTGGGIAHSAGKLVLADCQVAHNAAGFGGGIYVESGTLVVTASVIDNNAAASGAGIYNAGGEADIYGSSIHSNEAGAFSLGGGIYTSGKLRVESTTISGNTASFGAGVFSRNDLDSGEATLISNSTISGNTAFDRGGGVRNAVGLTIIQHSTITGNQAPEGEGSGVASRGYPNARTEIGSTIIAGNAGSDVDFGTGSVNTFQSLGYNVIGTGNALAKLQAAGDRTSIRDPLLAPLADNGGPTLPAGGEIMTHALLPGSPAIDGGDLYLKVGVPVYDQRGEPFTRVYAERIDIGAYEQQPNPLTGDYNFDGIVDAADYVLWQNTRGLNNDLRADGNGDDAVDDADRMVWAANFGQTAATVVQLDATSVSVDGEGTRDRMRPPPRGFVRQIRFDQSDSKAGALDRVYERLGTDRMTPSVATNCVRLAARWFVSRGRFVGPQ